MPKLNLTFVDALRTSGVASRATIGNHAAQRVNDPVTSTASSAVPRHRDRSTRRSPGWSRPLRAPRRRSRLWPPRRSPSTGSRSPRAHRPRSCDTPHFARTLASPAVDAPRENTVATSHIEYTHSCFVDHARAPLSTGHDGESRVPEWKVDQLRWLCSGVNSGAR